MPQETNRRKMRIALLTIGNHGDIQPLLALGEGLQVAGHDVLVITHALLAKLVNEQSIAFAPVGETSFLSSRSQIWKCLLLIITGLRGWAFLVVFVRAVPAVSPGSHLCGYL